MTTLLTCTTCPRECTLTVVVEGTEITVTGNSCKRGEIFGKKEVTAPERQLASTVCVKDGTHPLLPVRTSKTIPKELLFEAMKQIDEVTVCAPVEMGQVIIENILNTGADITASRSMQKR